MTTKLHSTEIPELLLKSLDNYNVTFLTAPPAYGKSVLLTDVLSSHYRKAIILIPNTTSVMLLHEYTSKIFPDRNIGYKMYNNSNSTQFDDVTLITHGYFLEWITYNKKVMLKPLTLVIDEAHVADWQTDLVIRMALYYRTINKNLKIILSSATLDITRFSQFIPDKVDFISLPGEKPNVTVEYIKCNYSEIPNLVVRHLIGVNTLIICPGENEINELMSIFENCEDPVFQCLELKCLYSKLDTEDISDALSIGNEWTILLATNIVESSVTIKNINAVIDLGIRKLAYLDNKGRMSLKTKKAAKSNIIQGLSRCGRGEEVGLGFVLMSERDYKSLEEFPECEVYRNPLYNQIFRLIRAELPIKEMFCEHAVLEGLEEDMELMRSHGIIKFLNSSTAERGNNSTYELTSMGKIISKIQLSLLSNKFLIDVIFHDETDIWYYALLVATRVDLTDPMFYKPKMKFKESKESFYQRYEVIKEMYQKYKIGSDCLDEVLLISQDLFIITSHKGTDNNGYIQVDIDYKKLNKSGLNTKSIKNWKKLINYTSASLHGFGYSIKYNGNFNINNSDTLRGRLSPYLYSSYSDSFYNIKSFHNRSSLKIDNNCDYGFIQKRENYKELMTVEGDSAYEVILQMCSSKKTEPPKDEDDYIFGLGNFSAGHNDIISKIIKYNTPIMSDKVRILMYTNLKIPIDIWENIIFNDLTLKEILNVMTASRF